MLSKMSNVPMSRIISFLFTLFVCLVPGRWCFAFGLILRYTRRLPQLKYFSIFFMFPMQNTTTLSPSFICVEPFMSCPFPSRTSPPKVMLGGSPRSLTCYFCVFCNNKLSNVSVRHGQAFYVSNVGVQHHLVYVACRYCLLVYYRSYVQAFRHRHVV